MLSFIVANLGTIIISFILVLIVAAILYRMIKNKKIGKSPCGCSCGKCPMSGNCCNNKK